MEVAQGHLQCFSTTFLCQVMTNITLCFCETLSQSGDSSLNSELTHYYIFHGLKKKKSEQYNEWRNRKILQNQGAQVCVQPPVRSDSLEMCTCKHKNRKLQKNQFAIVYHLLDVTAVDTSSFIVNQPIKFTSVQAPFKTQSWYICICILQCSHFISETRDVVVNIKTTGPFMFVSELFLMYFSNSLNFLHQVSGFGL